MDDSKPLIKKDTRPLPWTSCNFLVGRHQRLFVLMVVMLGIAFVVIVSTFYGSNSITFGMTNHLTYLFDSNHQQDLTIYRIMFDAGSTGSRIHIFKFLRNTSGHPPKLLFEVFEEINPGLSFYAAEPSKASESLIPLLEKAKTVIPSSKRNTTTICLKATAGLRLLPEETADQLLEEVEKLFKRSEFLVIRNSVSIMDGIDEGLFAWVTVNYLKGKLDIPTNTYGTLDLGGGSTQITFKVNSSKDIPSTFLHPLELFNKNSQLYTYSYLGFGLMSARYQLFGQNETQYGISNSSVLYSVCIHPKHSTTWTHAGNNFTVKGFPNKHYGFSLCYAQATNLVKKIIHKPVQLNRQKFYIFSYYFDRAVDAKLVGPEGGEIKVSDFFSVANKVCNNPRKDRIFLCMDLSYISALLIEGYGFRRQTEILLAKNINKVVVSWALGAALTLPDTVDRLG